MQQSNQCNTLNNEAMNVEDSNVQDLIVGEKRDVWTLINRIPILPSWMKTLNLITFFQTTHTKSPTTLPNTSITIVCPPQPSNLSYSNTTTPYTNNSNTAIPKNSHPNDPNPNMSTMNPSPNPSLRTMDPNLGHPTWQPQTKPPPLMLTFLMSDLSYWRVLTKRFDREDKSPKLEF